MVQTILIADDHPLFREVMMGLVLRDYPRVDILEAETAADVDRLDGDRTDIDLLLLDLGLPGGEPRAMVDGLRQRSPGLPIVIVSAHEDPQIVRWMIEHGVRGYIPKSTAPRLMASAVQLVLAGGTYLPANTVVAVPGAAGTDDTVAAAIDDTVDLLATLTPRQVEVLELMAEGFANKETGARLDISIATVKLHVNAILRGLGTTNRTAAALAYAERQRRNSDPYRGADDQAAG